MSEILMTSTFFGVTVSLLTYMLGVWLKKKLKFGFLNPLLISIIVTIIVVVVCKMDYNTYYEGAKYISYLLTPATVCLAIPLYEQLEQLKRHWKAIVAGILSGVITSLLCVLIMAILFGLTHETYVTLLPKSITTAIGMGVSEELGGVTSITAAVIIVTGVFGNVIGDLVLKLFRIREPVAKGVALGTSAHAIGTSKAMELGEVEGAMSSLSIAVAGLLTVIGASVFAMFW
jgi:predicted murein hydrolase (TIGR00659 family)